MYIQQGSPSFHRTNLALFCGGFSTFAILYCVQPLLPEFSNDFHISPALASLSLSVSTISMAISMLLVGAISDAKGRKSVMSAALAGASLMAILEAFSPNFHFLLLFRIIQGMVLAGLPAIAMAYLSEEVDPTSLGYAMGLYISGNSIGGMGGRIITGMVTDHSTWRIAIAVIGVLSIISALLFWIFLPASRNFKRRPFEIHQLVSSLVDSSRNRRLIAIYALGFLMMGSFVTLFNYIGYHLIAPPYHLSQTIVGFIFVVYIVGTFSSTWMGRLADKYGRRQVLMAALCIILAGALFTLSHHLWMIIIGVGLLTFGFFGGHSIASSSVGLIAHRNKAQASSLYLFFYYLGSSVSGTVGGFFYTQYDWGGVIAMIACYMIIALVISIRLSHYGSHHNPSTFVSE